MIGPGSSQQSNYPDDTPAARQQAITTSRSVLLDDGPEDLPDVLGAIDSTDAVIVDRLDKPGASYYVVFLGSQGHTPIVTLMDATAFHLLEIGAAEDPQSDALHWTDPGKIDQDLQGQTLTLLSGGQTIEAKIDLQTNTKRLPRLAWRPCLESFSAFLPFYVYRFAPPGPPIPNSPPFWEFYVRTDGEIALQLTTDRFGV
jgi:hypothetical protein